MRTVHSPPRRGLLAAAAVFALWPYVAAVPLAQESAVDARLERLEQWLIAVLRHEPGTADESAAHVAAWSARDVRTLWIDVSVLVQLMRDPSTSRFDVKVVEQRKAQAIRYTPPQLQRLRVLSCAAAGALDSPFCASIRSTSGVDVNLRRLSGLVEVDRGRQRGDDGFVLRRGALLHTDIAIFFPHASEPIGSDAMPGPERLRVHASDGRPTDMGQVPPHWELARLLLDDVKPGGAARPAPGQDEMVRSWYRATAAWMQFHEQHDRRHLDRAREIFPGDADILFLSACQHEAYAGRPIQSAVQAIVAPTGFTTAIGAERSELRRAETYFRRALVANPASAEAHVRFGRVLSLLERYADAGAELEQGLEIADDAVVRYFGELFLGAVREARRDFGAAEAAYAEAARLYPTAQSPRMALSALARRRGDRLVAVREMQALFERPHGDSARGDDPWWSYFVVQARNADDLLDAVRRPFREDRGR
jgi:hypothetical protein